MHERGLMADKRRYYHDKEANSTASDGSRHSAQRDDDQPPNSRLFLLCGRNVSEDELKEAFDPFGEIKELWIVKEKDSGVSRGTFDNNKEQCLVIRLSWVRYWQLNDIRQCMAPCNIILVSFVERYQSQSKRCFTEFFLLKHLLLITQVELWKIRFDPWNFEKMRFLFHRNHSSTHPLSESSKVMSSHPSLSGCEWIYLEFRLFYERRNDENEMKIATISASSLLN